VPEEHESLERNQETAPQYGHNMKFGTLMDDLIEHKKALRREIEYLKTKLQDEDTGHIRTAISVLEGHINDIETFIDGIHMKAYEYLKPSTQG